MLSIERTLELLAKWSRVEVTNEEKMPRKQQQLNFSGHESDVVAHVTDQDESMSFKSVPVSETCDDLKAEFFNYVTVETGTSVPNPGKILFFADKDAAQATMTWRYYEPRVLTNVKAMQVPFSIQRHHSAAAFDESIRVPCVLQFSLSLGDTFKDYSEFFLSQNQSSQAELPDVANSNGSYVVAAEIWRVVMNMPPSDHHHLSEEMELLVSPLTLAASLRVDSRFVSELLPVFYVTSQINCVRIQVFNHPSHVAKVESSLLSPFRLVNDVPKRELVVISVESFLLTSASSGSPLSHLHHFQMKTSLSCDVLEYRSLTLLPMLDRCSLSSEISLTSSAKPRLQVDVQLDKMFIRISPSVVQTISDVAHSWLNLHSPDPQLLTCYVICNNTLDELHFGQVETNEDLVLPSREAVPYSWRSTKAKELLRLTLKSLPRQALSSPASSAGSVRDVDIHQEGIFCTAVNSATGQDAMLIIKVSKLSSTVKQVVISGLVFFTNHLDRPLQVKILTKNSAKDTTVAVALGSRSASCVMDVADIRALRLNITTSAKTGWSQEIVISYALTGLLAKVPLTNPAECIYVWCQVISQNHFAATETMIVFCPLFVVKSRFPSQLLMNVKTPKLKTVMQLELEGRGLERQLVVGGRDLIHNITFQINSTTQASTPPLMLSADTIEQVDRVCLADADIFQLSCLWQKGGLEDSWPYNAIDDVTPSVSQAMNQKEAEQTTDEADSPLLAPSVSALDSPVSNSEDQPNIELQVKLSQFWPGLNTLLIDVSPHWLFVNESGLDAVLVEADSNSYKLPSRRTIAPSVFKGAFRIGVMLGGRIHLSDFVELSDEERNIGYLYPTDGLLYLDGHLQVRIPVCHDDILVQHCFLSLHSTYKHNMRVVTVRERFQFVNRTPFDLQLYITTVESTKDRKVLVPDDPRPSLMVRGKKQETDQVDQAQSLLLWNVLQSSESCLKPNAKYFPHIRFRYLDSKLSSGGTGDIFCLPWSYPFQLSLAASTGMRHSVAIPCYDDAHLTTRTCVLTVVSLSEVVYLVLEEEFFPSIELINNCDVTLFFGQSVSTAAAHGVVVQEQLGVISNLPFVQPHSSCHYTLPIVDSLFPDIHENLQSAKLHVGALNSKHELIWSQALDIHADQSIFVVISKVSDLKVDIKRLGHTIRVRLNPVSRAEVSAKEIRSRIKGKSVVTVEEVGRQHRKKSVSRMISESTAEAKEACEPYADVRQDRITSEIPREEKTSNPQQIELSCFCHEACIVLFEELPSAELAPFLCVTLDEVGILVHPKVDVAQAVGLSGTHELFACVYDLQVDNSSFATGDYDFPVLLKRLEPLKSDFEDHSMQSLKERIKLLHGGAMVSISAELFHDKTFNTTSLQTLKLTVEPLLLFVEDTYCWNLLKIVDKLVPFSLLSDSASKSNSLKLPLNVRIAAGALASPLRLRHLCIDPIKVQMSVHASLKLFISSDRAPLSFSRFERKNICTNSQQLFRALAMHYAVSAIYRAALLFGSLGILGNPTGFVRSIGNGVADLIRLPYDGLTKGPGPCISGLGGGMKSVARHFSAGTLTSITNFASSISRNMERLSMDNEHIQRNELTRRRRPSGLSEGLLSGLSGFGLSVLGAIAGVADQPLQTFTRSDMASYSTSDKAKGVVSGFGKGLIGMVTKPLGGAAEFVSQTSLGLLQGIGLMDACQPRDDVSGPRAAPRIKSGSAKYHEKVLHLSPSDEILFYVHGCHITSRTVTCCICALVLTSGCFYVVSEETEELLCTFPVVDISLRKRDSSDGALRLVLRSGEERNESNEQTNSARLAAFIDDTTLATALCSVEERKFPLTSTTNFDPMEMKYEFCFDQRTMDTLIAWFIAAKNKNRRDSFSV